MVKLLRLLKVVAINVITFVVLVFIVNWLCGVLLKSDQQPGRDTLPNYADDKEHAKAVFRDYYRVKHQYEPFVGWKTLPYEGPTTHINSSGRRTHTLASSGQQKEKTVRFFGGSTMWGEGSDDQHTIPALFNEQFPQFEVHNHAQLAYNTRQELDALISLYSKNEKTDLVIFYDGVNDAAFLCPKEITELPAHRLVPLFRQKLYVAKSVFIKEAVYETFLENIVKTIFKFSSRAKESPYDCLSDPDKAEEIAEIMMRNWELAHDIVTSHGGKFVAVLQPAALVGNPKTDHLELDPDFKQNFAAVYKHIKSKIASRNYDWIYDLCDKFDGDSLIFIDFCHVSPNGNEIMAKEISNIVESLGEEKKNP